MASEQVWVVAACFNEAEVISAFIERVVALPDVDRLLLIDDGSSDATVAVIRAWQKSHADQAVTLLELTRNFGKEAAMLAGLDYANGRCAAAVLIDSDLQQLLFQSLKFGDLTWRSAGLLRNSPIRLHSRMVVLCVHRSADACDHQIRLTGRLDARNICSGVCRCC